MEVGKPDKAENRASMKFEVLATKVTVCYEMELFGDESTL